MKKEVERIFVCPRRPYLTIWLLMVIVVAGIHFESCFPFNVKQVFPLSPNGIANAHAQ
jgi:hypothetical protein